MKKNLLATYAVIGTIGLFSAIDIQAQTPSSVLQARQARLKEMNDVSKPVEGDLETKVDNEVPVQSAQNNQRLQNQVNAGTQLDVGTYSMGETIDSLFVQITDDGTLDLNPVNVYFQGAIFGRMVYEGVADKPNLSIWRYEGRSLTDLPEGRNSLDVAYKDIFGSEVKLNFNLNLTNEAPSVGALAYVWKSIRGDETKEGVLNPKLYNDNGRNKKYVFNLGDVHASFNLSGLEGMAWDPDNNMNVEESYPLYMNDLEIGRMTYNAQDSLFSFVGDLPNNLPLGPHNMYFSLTDKGGGETTVELNFRRYKHESQIENVTVISERSGKKDFNLNQPEPDTSRRRRRN